MLGCAHAIGVEKNHVKRPFEFGDDPGRVAEQKFGAIQQTRALQIFARDTRRREEQIGERIGANAMLLFGQLARKGAQTGLDMAKGNAELLETLRRRFVTGPIDWAKEWGK